MKTILLINTEHTVKLEVPDRLFDMVSIAMRLKQFKWKVSHTEVNKWGNGASMVIIEEELGETS